MKAGELVRIKRASIGAPAGSIGLITEVLALNASGGIYAILMAGGGGTRAKVVRRLGADLEVISA